MINFRKEFDSDSRFKLKKQVKEIIDNNFVETQNPKNNKGVYQELTLAAENASYAYTEGGRESTFERLKKVINLAALRDFQYGQRGYKYLKGLGYIGLSIENYVSSDKLTKYSGQ